MGKSIGRIILESLSNLEIAAGVAYEFMDKPYKFLYKDIFDEYRIRRNSFKVAVHRALKAGWVEKVKRDGEIHLRLTTSGHTKLMSLGELTKEKWDGVWRVVVFDIPEESKKIRNLLRRNLRVLGFVPWQKSVWISPLSHEDEVTRFLKENNLEKNVVVLKTRELLIEDSEGFKEGVRNRLSDDLKPLDWK